MRKKKEGLSEFAHEHGLLARKAKEVAAYVLPDQEGRGGGFITFDAARRMAEAVELAGLTWLLNIAQDENADFSIEDFHRFIELNFDHSCDRGIGGNSDLPTTAALELTRDFAKQLRQFVEQQRDFEVRQALWKVQRDGPGPVDVKWKVEIGKVTREISYANMITASGSLRSGWHGAFLLRASDLIHRYGRQIRSCAYEPCQRLFVGDPSGHQRFCSLICGKRERQRQFRAKYPGEKWKEYRSNQRKERLRQAAKGWRGNR
jgi:hypothetical protein